MESIPTLFIFRKKLINNFLLSIEN